MIPIQTNDLLGQLDALDHLSILRRIGEIADSIQLEAYVVGGFVRDVFLQRTGQDIDIVCVGDGMLLAQAVAQHLDNVPVTLFKRFGTAMLTWQGLSIEFVGARKESYTADSRNPAVAAGTLLEDQTRRDFTINTMAVCLNQARYGLLLDPFQGYQDLVDGLIRTPCDPYITFSDDPLRIIRAIRFATQLNFRIGEETWNALVSARNRLAIVAQERIAEELHKIVAAHKPSYGFKLLFEAKVLSRILPELEKLSDKEEIEGYSHKDNFIHTLEVLDNVAHHSSKLWLRWAALFHDIAKPLTKKFDPITGFSFHGHENLGAKMLPYLFRRMRFPTNKEILGYVQKLVRLHLRPIALAQEVTDTAIRRLLYEVGEDLADLFLLCRADITSKNKSKVQQYLANFDRVEARVAEVEQRDQMRNFQPIITGEVIMQAFGLRPSPQVGFIKEAVKEAILEGKIKNSYEEAFRYMLMIGEQYGLQLPKH
ncbi:CCA tRNA nucleotidyltransferase [Candidatus Cardinium hertigii]|uniref:Multifunctional CCA protein n=1 Tax=Candidatus Cardinium hertigii TaxID=247481 RepID=A0A2Z3LF38_9BACT|nr:HD domain-containing protein [Candidatus Cardinium hertigii]AWN82296.1 Multifunctional CCA protein [Candidatus Cardinium hertigii]